MADELTVRSPGAGNSAVATERSEQPKVDKRTVAATKLRKQILERTGKRFTVKEVEGRTKTGKQRLARAEKKKAKTQSFEENRSRESVQHGDVTRREQHTRTTGASSARHISTGLTPEQVVSISCDPKAGPTLPMCKAQAPTPEQAGALLGQLVNHITFEEQPVDIGLLEDLFRSSEARTKLGAAPSSQTGMGPRTVSMSLSRLSQTSNKTVSASKAVIASNVPISSAPASHTPVSNTGGSPGAASTDVASHVPASGSTEPSTGKDSPSPSASGDWLSTVVKGGRRNWDQIFTLFRIKFQKDQHLARKLMRELRKVLGEFAIAAQRAQIARVKMNQQFERLSLLGNLNAAMKKVSKDIEAAKTEQVTGTNPEAAARHSQQMSQKAASIGKKVGELGKDHPLSAHIGQKDNILDAGGQQVLSDKNLDALVASGQLNAELANELKAMFADYEDLQTKFADTAEISGMVAVHQTHLDALNAQWQALAKDGGHGDGHAIRLKNLDGRIKGQEIEVAKRRIAMAMQGLPQSLQGASHKRMVEASADLIIHGDRNSRLGATWATYVATIGSKGAGGDPDNEAWVREMRFEMLDNMDLGDEPPQIFHGFPKGQAQELYNLASKKHEDGDELSSREKRILKVGEAFGDVSTDDDELMQEGLRAVDAALEHASIAAENQYGQAGALDQVLVNYTAGAAARANFQKSLSVTTQVAERSIGRGVGMTDAIFQLKDNPGDIPDASFTLDNGDRVSLAYLHGKWQEEPGADSKAEAGYTSAAGNNFVGKLRDTPGDRIPDKGPWREAWLDARAAPQEDYSAFDALVDEMNLLPQDMRQSKDPTTGEATAVGRLMDVLGNKITQLQTEQQSVTAALQKASTPTEKFALQTRATEISNKLTQVSKYKQNIQESIDSKVRKLPPVDKPAGDGRRAQQQRRNDAAEKFHANDEDYDPGIMGIAADLMELVRSSMNFGPIEQAAEKAMAASVNAAKQARVEVDGEIRALTSRAQGMIDQLMQLMRMARSS